MAEKIDLSEQKTLLKIARTALEQSVHGAPLPSLAQAALPPSLMAPGASFVTLTKNGRLRGCIGTLEAYQPLAEDVQEHAVTAALEDPRFPVVQPPELPHIHIEVSVLTPKKPLSYHHPEDLLEKLQPKKHGVVLKDGFRKATFLPQVWEKLPNKVDFLSQLCLKMGAPANLWKNKQLDVFIYEVQEFQEE